MGLNPARLRTSKCFLAAIREDIAMGGDPQDHPLNTQRMLAALGLLAITGIGVALMSIQIFFIGALICGLAVAGIVWLYWSDFGRLRLRTVNHSAPDQIVSTSEPTTETWLAIGVALIAIAAPVSIAAYALIPKTASILSSEWHLTADQRARLAAGLKLASSENYWLDSIAPQTAMRVRNMLKNSENLLALFLVGRQAEAPWSFSSQNSGAD
jgi:hypothetical protein